jgi:hypothetical protein
MSMLGSRLDEVEKALLKGGELVGASQHMTDRLLIKPREAHYECLAWAEGYREGQKDAGVAP